MDEPRREPCSSCGEPIALEARICHHCNRSALVELRLPGPVADARARYQAARALSALGGPFAAMGPLQQAMGQPRPRVAGGLTRAQAHAGLDVLVAHGLDPAIAPASPPGGGGLKLAGGIALGGAALAFAAWWMLRPGGAVPDRTRPKAAAGSAAIGTGAAAELTRKELARVALASTASLRCGNSVGAGFFVAEGLLLTNAHVLCGDGVPVKVALADGREASGTPLRSDDELDLALVSVSGLAAPPLPLGDAGAVAVGDRVLMVGSPVGMDFTVHEGMVSAVGRVVLGAAYIQLDAKVNPGNSGGPILDARGRAVGVVSLKRSDAEGIALALPINYAWTGGHPMIEPPAGRSAAFDAQLARAEAEDRELAGRMASEGLRPLLVGAVLTPQRQLAAQILRPARGTPYAEDFSFRIWNGENEVCSLTASVTEWTAAQNPPGDRSNARVRAWLERHGLSATIYVGAAPLPLDQCPPEQLQPGVQLELQGADPASSRLTLR